jgi:imidazoleglycerol phosphate synthase glutamine amidotransferase subunit HisH
VLKNKKPFLGICVGMQLLAEKGYENGTHQGLGWIKGSIKKLEVNKLKLPHMGWNNIKIINNSYEMRFDQKKMIIILFIVIFLTVLMKKTLLLPLNTA